MQKQRLVFIPGWGAGYRVWEHLAEKLSAYFDIKFIDLLCDPELSLGEGSNRNDLEDMSLAAIDGFIDKVADQIPLSSTVIGWSLGGMIATKIAHRYQSKVSKLILIASNLSFVERPDWPCAMDVRTFQDFVDAFRSKPIKTGKRFIALQAQGIKKRKPLITLLDKSSALCSTNRSQELSLLNLLGELNNTEELFNIEAPLLAVFGENDALVPISAAMQIRAASSGFRINTGFYVEIIEACGHVPQLSHPDKLFELVSHFLRLPDARYQKDKKKIASSFSKASLTYDKCASLQRTVVDELFVFANEVQGKVADLGCGTGFCIEKLCDLHPKVHEIVGVDISSEMLALSRQKNRHAPSDIHYCLADIERLPFKSGQFDWVISSLAVQWCEDLCSMFSGVAESLLDSGCFALSNLGPKTLDELNTAWLTADPEHVHVNHFFSDSDVIDAAERAGFELDRVSIDFKTLQYENVMDLMRDLKGIGAHNINGGSNKGLTGKSKLKALNCAYESFRQSNGMLPTTYEVQYWLFRKRRVLT